MSRTITRKQRSQSTGAGVSRRAFLAGTAGVAGAAALTNVAYATPGAPNKGDVVVVLFLDGGLDALSTIVPFTNNTYYNARPQTSIAGPGQANGCLQLSNKYGLHPALSSLYNGAWANGDLALVQAVGIPDSMGANRSHFFMTEVLKRGGASEGTGWLTRHLDRNVAENAMIARSWGNSVDEAFSGYGSALGGWSLAPDIYRLADRNKVISSLDIAYAGSDPASVAGTTVLEAMETLRSIDFDDYQAADGVYPDSGLGWRLRETAALIRSNVGAEVITMSLGGYDTHDAQGDAASGGLTDLLRDLGDSLGAFYADLGSARNEVTVVVYSEFGRQIVESGSAGTDHGAGGAMMVMGGNVNGGLYGPDSVINPNAYDNAVPVAVDYQTVLGEVLAKRRGETNLNAVFPNRSNESPLGVCQ